jgi:SulP family sulfate permease
LTTGTKPKRTGIVPNILSGQATVLVIQVLDFFAEVPALDDQMPPARTAKHTVVVLVIRDLHTLSSTEIKWLERYVQELKANDSLLILADVNPEVVEVLEKSSALEAIGAHNIFPATPRVLEADNLAWEAAQEWLKGLPASPQPSGNLPTAS